MDQCLKLTERLIKFRIDHYVVIFSVVAHLAGGLIQARRNLLRVLPAAVDQALGENLY